MKPKFSLRLDGKEDGENDYTLVGESAWITVGEVQLYLYKARDEDGTETVTVEAMPRDRGNSAMDPPLEWFSLVCNFQNGEVKP